MKGVPISRSRNFHEAKFEKKYLLKQVADRFWKDDHGLITHSVHGNHKTVIYRYLWKALSMNNDIPSKVNNLGKEPLYYWETHVSGRPIFFRRSPQSTYVALPLKNTITFD
jgi:hypothetical protein